MHAGATEAPITSAGISESAFSMPHGPHGTPDSKGFRHMTSSEGLSLSMSSRDRSRRMSAPHSQSIDLGVSGYRMRVSLPEALDGLQGTTLHVSLSVEKLLSLCLIRTNTCMLPRWHCGHRSQKAWCSAQTMTQLFFCLIQHCSVPRQSNSSCRPASVHFKFYDIAMKAPVHITPQIKGLAGRPQGLLSMVKI
jgi:hypothetical protein